jgi:GT2 family glycosyltransferase
MSPGDPAAPEAAPLVTAVVPTVGRSPLLAACLAALRAQRGAGETEILVVDQADSPVALPAGLADRVLRPGRNLGFAGGTNLGIAAARGAFVATVNDDALVAPDWLAILTAALLADPGAAAVQGVNLQLDSPAPAAAQPTGAGPAATTTTAISTGRTGAMSPPPDTPALPSLAPRPPERLDGCGLAWNGWWQAVQLGHGDELAGFAVLNAAPPPPYAIEIFGVSATAALFRRAALERVAPAGNVFDPRLVSYYEDAELAGRLRAAGFRALLAPRARAQHAGSASGRTASRERWRLIYGNRYLAAARLLGRGFWPRLPAMVCRDLADVLSPRAWRAAPHRRAPIAGIALGWARAARLLPAFAHRGAPAPPVATVARLRRLPAEPG